MRNNLKKHIPDELKIEQLLGGFKPQPSTRYYERMSSAPWFYQDQAFRSIENKKSFPYLKTVLAFATIIIVLGVLSLSFIPSIRAAADQFIHFFLPATSDQLNVQITPGNPLEILDFTNPSNFTLTKDEAQRQAGFMVKQIPASPTVPSYIGARFIPEFNAVFLLYQGTEYTLLVTQRPLGTSQDVLSIGSNAKVEFVNVGNVQGEYVVGGWKAVSTQAPSASLTQTGTMQINAVWDDQLPQFTLRWQESGFTYELRSNGENSPSLSQLISWANELK
jgi:hypothetical protein